MIAKLIVWDDDRDAALRRLRRALGQVEVAGLTTNVAFLGKLAAHAAFAAADFDTGFIERHRAELLPGPEPVPDHVVALACLAVLARRRAEAAEFSRRSEDPYSPWFSSNGWRLNVETHNEIRFTDDERLVPVTVHYQSEGYRLDLPSGSVAARGRLERDGTLYAELGPRVLTATVVRNGGELEIFSDGVRYALHLDDPWAVGSDEESLGGRLTAPMPGKIIQLLVEPGAEVKQGAAILILEAMKMEHTIAAPADGRIEALHYAQGDMVEEGAELVAFEATGA